MTNERIIDQILSRRSEVSREEILERLDREKRKTGSFISDETLLRMIAAEFGVEIEQAEASAPKLSLGDLIPGLSDVTVVGRIVAVFPPKTFRRDESRKVASLLIADRSAILRVVLWNDKTSLMESGKLNIGQIIRFSHGYTREDRSGRVELHLGDRCEVQINPKDVEAEDYPTISKFRTKIGQVSQAHKNKKVNVIGKVKELLPISTFTRQDSSAGKVRRFVLADETGEIPVVVWNEKVDELQNTLRKNTGLQVVNAKVKKSVDGGLEIHIDGETYVGVLEPEKEFLRIADLKEGLSPVNVEGEVVTRPMFREVKTSKEELVKLAVFELKDETGRIWVSAWRNHAESAGRLKLGDRIAIKNAYVKKGFGDQLEISTRTKTHMDTLSNCEN